MTNIAPVNHDWHVETTLHMFG